MKKKAEKQMTKGRRHALGDERHDRGPQLSSVGINGQLTSKLRDFYETSLLEPVPDKFLELLERLPTSIAK
ncbi:MAG TPA: NepR family anti-sigma factor [Methylocystis sp.]